MTFILSPVRHIVSPKGSSPCSMGDRRSLNLAIEASGPESEISLLRDARGHPRRAKVRLAGGDRLTGELEQVPADRVEAVGMDHAVILVEGSEHGEAGPRPVDHRD